MHPITQRNPMKKIRHELMTHPLFLLKLPRNYGIFFLKEEKEEVWEDNHADFADLDLFGRWG